MPRGECVSNDEIIHGFDEETCDYLRIGLQRVEGVSRCLAVELTGSVDAYNSAFLRRSLVKAMEAGYIQLVLLLPRLDYVSSAGVGTFLSMLRILMEKGGGLTFVNPHPKTMEILKLMHLHTFFSCSDSIDEALDLLAGRRPSSAFPRTLSCPICDTALRAQKPGRFRCPKCKTTLMVDRTGTACL